MTNTGGPYVQIAVLCETFIKGAQTGALSLINIVETVNVAGSDPREMPPAVIGPPLKIVINLWAGRAQGRYDLKLTPWAPSGLQGNPIDLGSIQFTGTPGVDTIVPMPPYELSEEGPYWFDVVLAAPGDDEGQTLTRIPVNVKYHVQPGS